MSNLDLKAEHIRVVPVGMHAHFGLALATWRRLRSAAHIRAERKHIRAAIKQNYTALIDTKSRALKSTGVFATEHENLEHAIVNLAYALEDYRDGV